MDLLMKKETELFSISAEANHREAAQNSGNSHMIMKRCQ